MNKHRLHRRTNVAMSDPDLSIIIVDDLQFSRIVVKTALKKAGYSGVRMADSATQALAMLDEYPADVILADWMMPEMDGLELTDKIRQRDEELGIYTAVILFTANDGVEYLVKAFEHGVDDYLHKPPNPQELAARVNAAARIANMQNDLLETSRQMEETIRALQEVAMLDPLTGAANQRMLDHTLDAHLAQASARNAGVCVAMVELNELADMVQEYPPAVIDEILVSLCRRLRRLVRPTDTVARVANNCFALVMHYSNMDDFKSSAFERILNGINQRPFVTESGELMLTGAIGAHYYRGDTNLIGKDEIQRHAHDKLREAHRLDDIKIAF
jgi:two-component system cell cycle response regulator